MHSSVIYATWVPSIRGALVCVIVGFWNRDYVSQLPCVRYYVVVKVLNILMRNASQRELCVLGA